MKMIVMSCSATKRPDEADLRAIDRYDGPMWKTLRARLAELPRAQAALESGELSIVVLSAQFGFMNWADMIPNYERLMTKSRADEVATWGSCEPFKVRDGVHDCEAILFAGGELYRSAMWKASKATAADRAKISETDGSGVGHHRAELSAWLEEHFGEPGEEAPVQLMTSKENEDLRLSVLDACIPDNPAMDDFPVAVRLRVLRPMFRASRLLPAPEGDVEVDRYRRLPIFWRSGEGYSASASCAIHFGYCDTLDELRGEIDDYFAEEAGEVPLDTPSLDDSFHRHEMGV